jgi:hypothetical protein
MGNLTLDIHMGERSQLLGMKQKCPLPKSTGNYKITHPKYLKII